MSPVNPWVSRRAPPAAFFPAIGWRATERHVREMLSEHLRPGYQLAICDVTDEDAQTIIANLGLVRTRSTR